jgi:predicted NBD/HSP70 family sugar kinase
VSTVDRLAIGLDIGGTKIDAVAADRERRVVGRVRVATDASGGEAVLESAVDAVETLQHTVAARGSSVGAGIPGIVDHLNGTVRNAVNLGIGEEPFAFGPALSDAVGLPVAVENDVNAATLGAALALGLDDLAYLSIGTGLAAGLLVDGRLHRGRRGVAGEIGHVPVDPNGPLCRCGQRGCLEQLASGAAIARRWPSANSPARDLFAAAARGVPEAIVVRDDVVGHLATAVLLLVLTADPYPIVLGGGVSELGVPLLSALQSALSERSERSQLLRSLDLPARLRLLADGLDAAVLGAAAAGAAMASTARP